MNYFEQLKKLWRELAWQFFVNASKKPQPKTKPS